MLMLTEKTEQTAPAQIRLAEPGDAAALAEIYRPSVEESATSFELDAPYPSEMERRRAAIVALTPWLVYATGDRVLGFAYAGRHRDRVAYQWSADATVYVGGDSHRRGVGRALYGSLFAILRLQGFCAVHAGVTLPNPGSVGLHEALGFRPIGVYRQVGWKLDRWHDVGWWQLELRDRRAPPPPLRTLSEVRSDPAWDAALASGLAP
jgi:phosphinothricin acetyltransferase